MTTYSLAQGDTTWVYIVEPSEDDLQALGKRYPHFHPLNLRDCRATLEYPKLDHHDGYLFLIMHFPVYEKLQRLSVANEFDVFVSEGLLVTVHHGQLKPLIEMFAACRDEPAERERLMGQGASPLLHRLIEALVNYCFPILNKVEANIHHIETNLFADNPRHILEEIAIVRRDVIALRRIIRPQRDIICALEKGSWPWIKDSLDLYWSDIHDHLSQLCAMLDDAHEVLAGLAETVDTLASHRIDEVVRVLTLATIVTLPLTVLSTIYSMNVYVPGKDIPFTFFLVVALGLVVTGVVLWALKRNDWL